MENLDALVGKLVEFVPALGMFILVAGGIFLVIAACLFVFVLRFLYGTYKETQRN